MHREVPLSQEQTQRLSKKVEDGPDKGYRQAWLTFHEGLGNQVVCITTVTETVSHLCHIAKLVAMFYRFFCYVLANVVQKHAKLGNNQTPNRDCSIAHCPYANYYTTLHSVNHLLKPPLQCGSAGRASLAYVLNKAHTYACAQFRGLNIPTLDGYGFSRCCLPAEILRSLLRIMYYLQYDISLYTSSTNWAIRNSEAEMRAPLELGTQPETQVKYLITKRYVER